MSASPHVAPDHHAVARLYQSLPPSDLNSFISGDCPAMPAPVSSPAANAGNLVSPMSLAASKNFVAVVDASNLIEAQVSCEVTTGGTAPTVGVTFSACKAYAAGATGSAPPITLTASSTSTTLPVSSTTGLQVGQSIAVVASATGIGESATIVSISGSTVTTGTLENSYVSGAYVYTYDRTPSFVVTPAVPSTNAQASNSDYSSPLFLGPAKWVIVAQGDTAQAATVTITVDKITAIQ
jgi:hypothetical protein